MSCSLSSRPSSDPVLLWLWYRPAAVTPIQSLAWEFIFAGPKKQQQKNPKIKNKNKIQGGKQMVNATISQLFKK